MIPLLARGATFEHGIVFSPTGSSCIKCVFLPEEDGNSLHFSMRTTAARSGLGRVDSS